MLRLRSICLVLAAALGGCAAQQPKASLPPFADVPPPPPLLIDSPVVKRTDVETEQPVNELTPDEPDHAKRESAAPASEPPHPPLPL